MWYNLVEVDQSASIRTFGKLHGLDMMVVEREPSLRAKMHLARFYAYFADVETKDGPVLRGESGNGNTPEDAIHDYAMRISGKLLVLKAYENVRKEIEAPEFG